jgi:hypothetical protein
MQHADREDVIVTGWLNGDDYEAALAYRRREPAAEPPRAPTAPPADTRSAQAAGQVEAQTPE